MRKNRLKQTLQAGNLALGLVHFSQSPAAIEVMGSSGIDWVTIDTEHACNDVGKLQELIRAADAAGITPVIRVPEVDRATIQQVLDAGAGGIMVSHVATREHAMAAVAAAKYPPLGARGACPTIRAADYDPEDWAAFTAQSNAEVLLFVLVEEKEGYEDIESILSVPGIDVVFLGNFDLSLSLGLPGETRWDHPVLAAALERVVAAARKHKIYVQVSLGTKFQEDPDYAGLVASCGVDLMGCGSDMLLLSRSCRRIVSLRPQLRAARGSKKALTTV